MVSEIKEYKKGKKPYYQFVKKSNDIPSFYNNNKNDNDVRDFNTDAKKLIDILISDKVNTKLISSIICYVFMTIDKKHHHIISTIEKYLNKHKNISIPPSCEIPIIFDNAFDVVLNNMKKGWSNLNLNFSHFTDCIYHTKNIHIRDETLKNRYPNILRLFKTTLIPIIKKHDILFKIFQAFNILSYLPTQGSHFFIKLRDMIYNSEECKKAIAYNIYIFWSKKTDKLYYINYIHNILTKNKTDIHKILKCISENPNFTKRLLKNALHKITSETTDKEEVTSISKISKNIARKCRTIANNAFVLAKMGTSVYTIGKKLENKFPGFSKALWGDKFRIL